MSLAIDHFSLLLVIAFLLIVLFSMGLGIVLSFILNNKFPKKMVTPLLLVLIIFGGVYWLFLYQREAYNTYHQKVCEPDINKNKVAVVIVKDGIYDNDRINFQVSKYYESVKKDLGIDNAGLERFDGTTVEDLDRFVDEIYLKDDVAYIILLGDDIPVADNTAMPDWLKPTAPTKIEAIPTRLECVNGNCTIAVPMHAVKPEKCVKNCKGLRRCSDVALSLILPPVFYSHDEKIDFVLKILETYTDYHNNFDNIINKYQKSALVIQHFYGYLNPETLEYRSPPRFKGDLGYYKLSTLTLFNNETEQVTNEMKKKHLVSYFGGHGTREVVGMGLDVFIPEEEVYEVPGAPETNLSKSVYTSLEEYSYFTKENGVPSLFVESAACESFMLERNNTKYCCWPQVLMESGVWAYYSFGATASIQISKRDLSLRKSLSTEETIGYAIRKNPIRQSIYFGDILAHFK